MYRKFMTCQWLACLIRSYSVEIMLVLQKERNADLLFIVTVCTTDLRFHFLAVGGDELTNLLAAERLYSEGLDKINITRNYPPHKMKSDGTMLPTVSERRFFELVLLLILVLSQILWTRL